MAPSPTLTLALTLTPTPTLTLALTLTPALTPTRSERQPADHRDRHIYACAPGSVRLDPCAQWHRQVAPHALTLTLTLTLALALTQTLTLSLTLTPNP